MKLQALTLMAAMAFFTFINANESLYEAINNLDLSYVKYELEGEQFSKVEKDNLLEAASTSVEICKDNAKWLMKSFKDMLRVFIGFKLLGAGSTIAAVSLLAAAASSANYNDSGTTAGLIGTGIGAVVGVGGIKLMIDGWNMKSATAKLNKAMQIKRLIQEIKVKD